MGKLSHKLARKRFQISIMAVGVLCTTLGIVLASIGMYNATLKTANALSHEFLSRLVRQVSLNIDDNIRQIESLLLYIELDQDYAVVMDAARQPDGVAPYLNVRNLEHRLLQTQLIRSDIKGFYLFDARDFAYYCTSAPSLKSDYRLRDEPWYDSLDEISGAMILGAHVPERYLLDDTEVISIVQRLKNLRSDGKYATMIIDVRLDMFDNIVSTLDFSDAYSLLVVSDDGVVYDNHGGRGADQPDLAAYARRMIEAQGGFEVQNGFDNYIVDYATSEATGWKVVCWADVNSIATVPPGSAAMLIVLAAATVLATALCIAALITRRFRTLNALNNGLDTIRRGSYDVHIEANRMDEIGTLCDTFNQMAARLNYLINTVERLEGEKKDGLLRTAKAELDALQAQINPHFIYNTLENISMMAEINDDNETRRMATALGKLIRISVKGSHIVSVAEELEHVQSYLLIQQIRFDNKFRVEFRMDPRIMRASVPKLILQPLIENCIHHALEPMEAGGVIEITGMPHGDDLLFIIEDNGVGIEPEQLARLRADIERKYDDENVSRRCIGLMNVNQRIKLCFGDERYGLRIESAPRRGTRIEVLIPNIPKEDDPL